MVLYTFQIYPNCLRGLYEIMKRAEKNDKFMEYALESISPKLKSAQIWQLIEIIWIKLWKWAKIMNIIFYC